MAEHGFSSDDPRPEGHLPDGHANGGTSGHASSPGSHMVPSGASADGAGASANGAYPSGTSADGSHAASAPGVNGSNSGSNLGSNGSNGGANGNGSGNGAGTSLSVDDPRTRVLLEQLLQAVATDSGGASAREKPHASVVAEGWAAFRRRWKPMFLIFALTLAAVSWKLRPTGVSYVATARMQLPAAVGGGSGVLEALGARRDAPGSALDTQIAIIGSRPFLGEVRSRGLERFKRLIQEKKNYLGAPLAPPAVLKPSIEGASFGAAAPTSPELIDVTVTSDRRDVSVMLANTALDVYHDRLVRKGDQSQFVNLDFVKRQRDKVEADLNKAKIELQKFKEKYKIFDVAEALSRSNAIVDDLTQRQRAAQIEADAGVDAASVSIDGSVQGLQQRASELRLRYEAILRDFFETSPEALAAKAELDAAQSLVDARRARLVRQNQLSAQYIATNLAAAQRRAAGLPAIEYGISKLQDNVLQRARTYDQLSTRYTSLSLSRAQEAASSEPIETAIDASPVSRTWSRAITTGLMCAFVVAALCALLLEQLDRSLHSVTDLEPLLPAGVLGTMPLLRGRAERRLAQMTGSQPMAPQVLEACRIVRSNLSFATMDSPAQTILITSAAPGEGKSLSALNLATVTAFDGRRVLLLDCDLRRPSQHTLNGLPLEPGFTNLLSGEASLEEALQATRVNNLSVMTAGTLPLNPPELLGSPEARRLLQDLKERFDIIVVDSPPVLALTDAQVLCASVDGVVMIVAAESTSKDEVQRAQAMLRHAGGRLLGAVFNKVRRGATAPGYGTYAAYGPNMLGRDRALSDSVGTLGRD